MRVSHWVCVAISRIGGASEGQALEAGRTVVDLLQCNDRVCRQALLRILVKQKSLRGDRALLRRHHGRRVL